MPIVIALYNSRAVLLPLQSQIARIFPDRLAGALHRAPDCHVRGEEVTLVPIMLDPWPANQIGPSRMRCHVELVVLFNDSPLRPGTIDDLSEWLNKELRGIVPVNLTCSVRVFPLRGGYSVLSAVLSG